MSFRQFGGINKLDNPRYIRSDQIVGNALDIGSVNIRKNDAPYMTIRPEKNSDGLRGAVGINVMEPQGSLDIDGDVISNVVRLRRRDGEINVGSIQFDESGNIVYYNSSGGRGHIFMANSDIPGIGVQPYFTINHNKSVILHDIEVTGNITVDGGIIATSAITHPGEFINDVSQSLFDLMFSQPEKFASQGDISSGSYTEIQWSYDHLYPRATNGVSAFSNGSYGNKLPMIEDIYIDISTSITGTPSDHWVNYAVLSQANKSSYDTSYKILKINQGHPNAELSNNVIIPPFSVRVYGKNKCIENGFDLRALYYYDLSFAPAAAPSTPTILLFTISDDVSISTNVSTAEYGNNETLFYIKNFDVSATLIETLSNRDLTSLNTSVNKRNILSNTSDSTNISQTLTLLSGGGPDNVLAGAKYNIQVSATNDNNGTSISSVSTMATFTDIPHSNSIPNNPSNIQCTNSNVNSYRYLDSTLQNATNTILVNRANNNTLSFNTSSLSFEITNSNLGTTHITNSTITNMGVNIGASTYTTLTATYNNGSISKIQTILNDFDSSTKQPNLPTDTNTDGLSLFSNPTTQDIWSGTSYKEGFRYKGSVNINALGSSLVENNKLQSLNVAFSNNFDNNLNKSLIGVNFLVDNLSGNPLLPTSPSVTITAATIKYCFGVASAATITYDVNYSVTNMYSGHNIIPSGLLSTFSITDSRLTNKPSYSFTPGSSDFLGNGEFTINATNRSAVISSSLQSNGNFTFNISAKNINNLQNKNYSFGYIASSTGAITDGTNIYCDYASFNANGPSGSINTLKINSINIYSLSISDFTESPSNLLPISEYNKQSSTKPTGINATYKQGAFAVSDSGGQYICSTSSSLTGCSLKYIFFERDGSVRVGSYSSGFDGNNAFWTYTTPTIDSAGGANGGFTLPSGITGLVYYIHKVN